MQIITIIILSAIIICIIYLIYYTYNLQKPSKGSCDYLKQQDPSIKWSDDCSFIQELKPDSSLKTPSVPLHLLSFTNAPGMGAPWGANIWYRYNYVNGKTGGYSKSGPWTTLPITAGSVKLPCVTSNCSNMQYSGKDSCNANLATLGTASALDYGITSNIYANVHRYVAPLTDTTPPTDNTPGKLIGMLIQGETGNGAIFVDTSKSPCTEISCSNVKGC